ncbi:MAG: hypothetical protein WB507_11790 [Solirubrobacterales bacterium]
MTDAGPLCIYCADLDHLVYLPAGDALHTRRARKASGLSVVVVRSSRARRRYERQGILVEGEALDRAESECLADEKSRTRRRQRERGRRAKGTPNSGRGRQPRSCATTLAARRPEPKRSPVMPSRVAAGASAAPRPGATSNWRRCT